MNPATVNVQIEKGDSRAFTYLLRDVNEVPLDISSLLSDLQVKIKASKNDSSSEIVRKSLDQGNISVPELGRISFQILSQDLKYFSEGLYFWELKLVFLDGTVETWFKGEFKIV
ncbi:hypothetical protein [Croceimicrobium sp.]|uniref:hypothetical protein n=1 Tax=Croceimicrobium sp. TaxID=2828340 RepID=UPI003BA8FEDA